ncbi:hypothetical protein GS500_26515 [Rhodococcus hoagii]|nr:hypothetical protein [Prescottella equi]
MRREPVMDDVVLFGCLRGMLAADPDSPVVDELNRILLGTTDAERVGLTRPPDTPKCRRRSASGWPGCSGSRSPRCPRPKTPL